MLGQHLLDVVEVLLALQEQNIKLDFDLNISSRDFSTTKWTGQIHDKLITGLGRIDNLHFFLHFLAPQHDTGLAETL